MSDTSGDLVPRVRHTKDIDLSKADPGCATCHGTGVSGTHDYTERRKGYRDRTMKVPVVCKCVQDRGGVHPDGLDRLQAGNDPHAEMAALRDRALAGGVEGVLELRQQGGYNARDGTWVCHQCSKVIRSPIESGPITLPPGWQQTMGRVVCSDACAEAVQPLALVEQMDQEVRRGQR